jgi:hypothetical protein
MLARTIVPLELSISNWPFNSFIRSRIPTKPTPLSMFAFRKRLRRVPSEEFSGDPPRLRRTA